MFLVLALGVAHADELPSMVNGAGAPIRWPTMPIPYSVDGGNDADLDPDGVVGAVAAAAAVWTDVEGSAIEFQYAGATTTNAAAHDDTNAVFFSSDWEHDPDLLALTSVWSYENGTAVGFDMQVNTMDHGWSLDASKERDRADVQNALAHEFGHAVGIGHLEKSPEATMYPSSPAGEMMKRDLSEDDVWVALNFYPGEGGAAASSDADGAGGLCAVAAGPSGLLPVIGGLVAAAAVARRRREEEA
jgi:hypothetical protein